MAFRIIHLGISSEHDMIAVRQRAREISAMLGFGIQDQVRIATAVSELARTVFTHAAGGDVEFSLDHLGEGASLLVAIRGTGGVNSGSGMDEALAAALVSAERLMDQCNVDIDNGRGQVVRLRKTLPAESIPTTATLLGIADSVMRSPISSTFNEVTLQNRELLDTLAELRSRQEDLLVLTQELEDTNRGVVALYAEIEEKAERLRQADVHKDEFLATLAHELRNPLAPIRNAVEIMRRTPLHDSAVHAKAQHIISRQVDHLARLVDDLLDVARISKGKITLQRQPTALETFINLAVETAQPFIELRQHRLHVKLPGEPLQVLGDPARLAQIVGNLLNNAAKYTASGGQIDLVAERLPQGKLRIVVRDNGIGLSSERIKTVFTLFAQGETAPDRAQDGLGIGLSLVQRLVSLHEGEIRVESAGRGKGSSFIVDLPLLDDLGAGAAAAPSATPVLTSAEAFSPMPTSDTEASAKTSVKILLVDDNFDSVTMTAMLLESFGHTTATAQDSVSALKEAKRMLPDLVLLDIGLPGVNGYEVARMLRREPTLHATRLIAVTGYGTDADKQKAVDAGFDQHLVKPVDLEALMRAVDTCQKIST
ncbi:MAG: ATP-binding protein [Pseudomonadota bacterium]